MDEQATGRETFKFSEVLSALSFVLDKVEGQPEGHVVRSCFVGMTIGESLGLAQDQRPALFYALLLKDAGCSSTSSGVAALFEADDFEVKKTLKTTGAACPNRCCEPALPYTDRRRCLRRPLPR
jgi:hypothetical protein